MAGTLYLVATPIGNLEDITQRALRILREVDIVACEDTRHTRVLLDHYGIKTKLVSYHEHNERERAAELGAMLESGSSIAVVSDAGTPGICDPGFRLVREAAARNIRVVPIPGPVALVAALVASGLPTDEFLFAGFLPARGQARRQRFEQLRSVSTTLIFYETPHRVAQALIDAYEVLGERKAAVARELTKLHEEIARGRLSELAGRFAGEEHTRGEMVLIIDREPIDAVIEGIKEDVLSVVERLESGGMDHRAALKRAAKELGLSRDEAYRRLVEAKNRNGETGNR
jgi:16S rRNA (cytidine1402-2'-O)-methyltransferase